MNKIITIPTSKIQDWDSFHRVFSELFSFPEFYGNNMNAWIDCMSDIDDPEFGITQFSIEETDTLVLKLEDAEDFKSRCPEQYETLFECVAFVNGRKGDTGAKIAIAI